MSKATTAQKSTADNRWAERMAHANAIEGNPLTPAEQALINKLIADGIDAKTAVQMIVDAAQTAKQTTSQQTGKPSQPVTVAE